MAHRVKLQEPDRSRRSARQVAKQHGIPVADVMDALRLMNEFVRHEASPLEPPVVRQLLQRLGINEPGNVQPTGPPENAPARDTSSGLTPPRRQAKRRNDPFIGYVGRGGRVEARPETSRDHVPAGAYTSQAPPREVDTFAAALDLQPSEALAPFAWGVRGINDAEREVWKAQGLTDAHAKIAAQCREAGLRPQDLGGRHRGLDRARAGDARRGPGEGCGAPAKAASRRRPDRLTAPRLLRAFADVAGASRRRNAASQRLAESPPVPGGAMLRGRSAATVLRLNGIRSPRGAPSR